MITQSQLIRYISREQFIIAEDHGAWNGLRRVNHPFSYPRDPSSMHLVTSLKTSRDSWLCSNTCHSYSIYASFLRTDLFKPLPNVPDYRYIFLQSCYFFRIWYNSPHIHSRLLNCLAEFWLVSFVSRFSWPCYLSWSCSPRSLTPSLLNPGSQCRHCLLPLLVTATSELTPNETLDSSCRHRIFQTSSKYTGCEDHWCLSTGCFSFTSQEPDPPLLHKLQALDHDLVPLLIK